MNSKTNNPFNIFYAFCLFIQFIFFGLWLTHVIDWSLWWIFSPILAMVGVTHAMIFFCGLFYIYGDKHDLSKT